MSKQLNIAFIGGLTNGQIVLKYLHNNKNVNLKLVITHPDDVQVARKVPLEDYFGDAKVIKDLDANQYQELMKEMALDYIFVAGWSGLLKDPVLEIPAKGVIGFHPSKLPFDRGRSVLAWQIEDGYEQSALTMFYYTTYPDGGDIIAQESFVIEYNDNINDVLDKVDEATICLMRSYFPLLRQGIAPRAKQDINEGSFRRLRGAKDSDMNWHTNANVLYNKVRAITKPYPGAEGDINGQRYKIWAAEVITAFPYGTEQPSGTLVAKLFDNSLIIRCKDVFLRVTDYEEMS